MATSELTDQLFISALKIAIVDAFFNQKSYYDNQNQRPVYYGGQAAYMVEQLMGRSDFKEVIDGVVSMILERKQEISDLIHEKVKAVVQQIVSDYLAKEGGNRYLERMITDEIQKVAGLQIRDYLFNSEDFKKELEDRVNSHDYDLQISVHATVKPKTGE